MGDIGVAVCVLCVFGSAALMVAERRLHAGASRKDAVKEALAFVAILFLSCFNLDGCATGNGRAAIHESYEIEQPTLAGNRTASGSSSFGGAIRQDRVRSPDGRSAVRECIVLHQEYMRWLAENGLTASNSPFGWWLAQGAITVPDRCIDHVTSGTPMNMGGAGLIGGRTWIR